MNFGINLSIWDWLFGTAYWPDESECPDQQPARLGFAGMERYPRTLVDRLLFPLSLIWRRSDASDNEGSIDDSDS